MSTNQFEELMKQADLAAQKENWEQTLTLIQQAVNIEPNHAGAQTGLGTCFLQLGRAPEAISHFQKAAVLEPDNPDVFNNLGVAQLIVGNLPQAEVAFKEALWLDDDNAQAWKNLAQVYLNQQDRLVEGVQILASVVQANPDDIDALLQLALSYEIGGDYESSKDLLHRVLMLQPGNAQAQQILEDIEQRERGQGQVMDIQRIARPEHAKKLAGLKSLLKSDSQSALKEVKISQPAFVKQKSLLAFYAPDEFAAHERLPAIKAHFEKSGYSIVLEPNFSPEHLNTYETMVFYSPNLSGHLVDGVNQCMQAKKPFHIDLDIDFHNLPENHPAYAQFGQGNPNSLNVLKIMLSEATSITAASKTLVDRLGEYSSNVEFAPPCWSREENWWNQPTPARDTINVGWYGSFSDIGELEEIRNPVLRFLQETPDATWVAAGAEDAFEMFSRIPEQRRRFLPPPTHSSIAFLLTNFDIILLPYRDNKYNQARSDLLALYAGVRRMNWIGSPTPALVDWKEGGLIAESSESWYKHLKMLAADPSLRQQLGEAGRQKAENRAV